MGCYINPPDCTKEEWLAKHGIKTTRPCEVTRTHVPVCLVDNVMFTAAGVGYAPLEVKEFRDGLNGRKATWWKVKREDARLVSPLARYESYDSPENFPEEKS